MILALPILYQLVVNLCLSQLSCRRLMYLRLLMLLSLYILKLVMMFDMLKVRRKLSKVGFKMDSSYMVYVNNDDPKPLDSYGAVLSYLRDYRCDNEIFKLQIYRVDIYNLNI